MLLLLWTLWRKRDARVGHCRTCDTACDQEFCNERCAGHYGVLSNSGTLSLGVKTLAEEEAERRAQGRGGMKRLLDIERDPTALDAMPAELVVALLEASYPRREEDPAQFKALAAWRHVSARYRRLIDAEIYPRMQGLPYDFTGFYNVVTDATLRLFPGLHRLNVNTGRISGAALRTLPLLRELLLDYNAELTDGDVAALTGLTSLDMRPSANIGTTACLLSLTRLTDLTVDYGVSLHGTHLQQLVALTKLDVHHCTLDGVLPALPALVSLDASDDMGDDSLFNAPHLTRLTAGRGDINETITADSVSRLTALRELDLGRFTNVESQALSTLQLLERMRPGDAAEVVNDLLIHLPRLTALDLSDNDHVSGAQLRQLTRLRELTLSAGGHISDRALAALTNLVRLNASGTDHVTGDALVALRQLRELRGYRGSTARVLALSPDCSVWHHKMGPVPRDDYLRQELLDGAQTSATLSYMYSQLQTQYAQLQQQHNQLQEQYMQALVRQKNHK